MTSTDRKILKSINRDIDRALAKARKQPMTSPFRIEDYEWPRWYERPWIMISLAVLVGICTVVVVMLVAGRLLR